MLCWHHLSADRPGGFALRDDLSVGLGAPLSSLEYDSALLPSGGCCRVTSSLRCKGELGGKRRGWRALTLVSHRKTGDGEKGRALAWLWGLFEALFAIVAYSAVLQQGFRLRDRSSRCLSSLPVYFTKCGLMSSVGVCTYLFPCLQFGVVASIIESIS